MKHEVAAIAAQRVQSGMVVGLGSGSTAAILVAELGKRWQSGELTEITGVATSFQATAIAHEYGIPMAELNDVDHIDLAIDGADEVDPQKNLIKGGGACHTREKLVDSRAAEFLVVVDSTKLVDVLGSSFPVAVEVLPMAYVQVMKQLEELGATPTLRMAVRKAGPVISDQGNLIVDAKFESIAHPADLEIAINNLPGVLDNGLFVQLATSILVGEIEGDQSSHREF